VNARDTRHSPHEGVLTASPQSRYQRAIMMPMFKRTKTTKTPEAAALERARES